MMGITSGAFFWGRMSTCRYGGRKETDVGYRRRRSKDYCHGES